MAAPEIRFCRLCGAAVEQRIPPLEDRLRAVCTDCGYIDYVNPVAVVGTIATWQQGRQILLCRRNIEPRRGYWTVPAGFMELGETTAEGAARETLEEAGARVELQGLFALVDVPSAGQVHLFHRARLLDLDCEPGIETIENRLFDVDELPWSQIAFRSSVFALRHYLHDLAAGHFGLHEGTLN